MTRAELLANAERMFRVMEGASAYDQFMVGTLHLSATITAITLVSPQAPPPEVIRVQVLLLALLNSFEPSDEPPVPHAPSSGAVH